MPSVRSGMRVTTDGDGQWIMRVEKDEEHTLAEKQGSSPG
jgi:hypothetical protein